MTKLLSIETKHHRRELRVCDYYSPFIPIPDFCQGKDPNEIVRMEIYGETMTARIQSLPGVPMPPTYTLPDGKVLKCLQKDWNGIITATGYFPLQALGNIAS